MAKGSRGGVRRHLSAQAPVASVTPAPTMSATYNSLMSMDDDEKAQAIQDAIFGEVPAHLSDSSFQRMTYNMGLNDKPEVVSDSEFSQLKGQKIYRTINSVYDSENDIGYTAPQIANQIMNGRVTRYSDNGGSAYGRGIYFAETRGSSIAYGNTRGNIKKTCVVEGILNDKAKIINHTKAMNGCIQEKMSGSKLGKILKKADYDSQVSIYAMAKGYNVIVDGYNDYLVVLNRQAVTFNNKITSK